MSRNHLAAALRHFARGLESLAQTVEEELQEEDQKNQEAVKADLAQAAQAAHVEHQILWYFKLHSGVSFLTREIIEGVNALPMEVVCALRRLQTRNIVSHSLDGRWKIEPPLDPPETSSC